MKFDPEQVRREKNENFEKAWLESENYIKKNTLEESYPRMKPVFGKPHPVYETIQKLREAYMRMGFSEYMNPLIVEERDIYKQFSEEAPAVLDRCFYLAGLPRPNVGISDEKIDLINRILISEEDAMRLLKSDHNLRLELYSSLSFSLPLIEDEFLNQLARDKAVFDIILDPFLMSVDGEKEIFKPLRELKAKISNFQENNASSDPNEWKKLVEKLHEDIEKRFYSRNDTEDANRSQVLSYLLTLINRMPSPAKQPSRQWREENFVEVAEKSYFTTIAFLLTSSRISQNLVNSDDFINHFYGEAYQKFIIPRIQKILVSNRDIKYLPGDENDSIEIIRKVLHAYKKGTIEGDDLVCELANQLNVQDTFVIEIIDKVFPEFKELKPEGTTKTLRSHMTSGWFITLSELLERNEGPFSLFSIDRCFRREQQEDASRLMTYYSASCVIMDENVTLDHGKMIAEGLLSQFGFEKFMFRTDEKRSKYYAPDTQIEVYAYHPKLAGSNTKYSDGWIEVATFGIYATPALSEYNIPMPVMNLGLGVERLAMILYGAKDMRYMTYPQFSQYGDWEMTDAELARQVELIQTPKTDAGREIADAIVSGFKQHGKEAGPCAFEVWKGELCGKTVSVSVIEPESETSLAGPAAFNEVVAFEGDILGVPDIKKWEKALENHSARTGFTFAGAFAAAAAAEAEEAVMAGAAEHESRVRMVKMLSEVNMKLTDIGQRYVTGNNKKIDVRGPVFTTVQFKIEE